MIAGAATRSNLVLVVIDAGAWAAWSALCGYFAHRMPVSRLASDRGLFRLMRFERDGRWYGRVVRVRRWKRWLPDAGALFPGGFSKRHVDRRDRAYLERFAAETRRAELTHWLILAAAPWFFAWNPWWLAAAMLAYGIVANVPCLLVQRYNRARLMRMIQRLSVAQAG